MSTQSAGTSGGGAKSDPRLAAALGHHMARRMEQALELYRQLLADYPGDPHALLFFGQFCHDMGEPDTAVQMLRASVSQAPGLAIAHSALATALRSQGDDAAAEESCRQAIALDAANAAPWTTLGNVLVPQKRWPEAMAAFERSVALTPGNTHAHCGIGAVRMGVGDLAGAVSAFRTAAGLDPANAHARRGLGEALMEQFRLDEAEAEFRAAVALDGDHRNFLDLGILCYYRGDLATATTCLRRAVAQAPNDVEAHFHLAAALLRSGNFGEGWAEYEWRRKRRDYPVRNFAQPEWAGEPLAGRTVLLYGEQGLGDCLQFAALAPAVVSRGGRVVLAVPSALKRLLRTASGVDRVVAFGEEDQVDFDCHLPLLSLPLILSAGLDKAPADIPYLHPAPDAVARWAERLGALKGVKVGLAWAGNPRRDDPAASIADRRRSLHLSQMGPLFEVPGVTWISLQKGEPALQAKSSALGRHLVDWMDEIDDCADTAALVANLDLVVTVDTSIAHLAGAMGVPVWILSRFDGCWRWLTDRDDVPWYPTARLVRQQTQGDWTDAVATVVTGLHRLCAEHDGGKREPAAANRQQQRRQTRHARKATDRQAQAASVAEIYADAFRHHQQGQLSLAETLYRQATVLDPGHADSFHGLGLLAAQGGRLDVATALFREAIRLNGDVGAYHNNLGIVLQNQGQTEGALACYRKAVAVGPDFLEAHNNLGCALTLLDRHAEAEAPFERVVAMMPDSAEAHSNLGSTLLHLGKRGEAEAHFERAMALKPDIVEARMGLGELMRQRLRLAEAEALLREAIALRPDCAEAHNSLGNVLWAGGMAADAVGHYERAAELKANYAVPYATLGKLLWHEGLFDDSARNLQKALGIQPDFVEAITNLGIVFRSQYRFADAVACFRQAVALDPDDCLALTGLGQILLDEGHVDEADSWLSRALSVRPNDDLAFSLLGKAKQARSYLRSLSGQKEKAADDFPDNIRSLPQFALRQYFIVEGSEDEAPGAMEAAMAALVIPPPLAVAAADVVVSSAPSALPQDMVALLHFGRSGTGLLHSLIDGHPEISTLPATYLQTYFMKDVWEQLSSEGWQRLPERFADIYEVLFDARSPRPIPPINPSENTANWGRKEGMASVGENGDEWLSLDRQRFCDEARRLIAGLTAVDPGLFLRVVHAAFERTCGSADKNIMFYHIHHPEYYREMFFSHYFPQARLVVMVREPVQSAESWVRENFENGDYANISGRIATMLLDVHRSALRRHKNVGVRLEDLKSRPQATMRALCAWLGVKDDPCLYQMTAQGKKWWGDPSSPDYAKGKAMGAFDDRCLKRRLAIFGDRDRFILGTLFHPFSVRFGYAPDDRERFRRDLAAVRPLIDEPMEFELALCARQGVDIDCFRRRGDYLHFRWAMLDHWRTLDRLGEHPDMLQPLIVEP